MKVRLHASYRSIGLCINYTFDEKVGKYEKYIWVNFLFWGIQIYWNKNKGEK